MRKATTRVIEVPSNVEERRKWLEGLSKELGEDETIDVDALRKRVTHSQRSGYERKRCHPERESRDLGDGWHEALHSSRPSTQVPRLTLGMTGLIRSPDRANPGSSPRSKPPSSTFAIP